MDTLIKNVANKKGIRTGIVNAAYDLDRKEPTVTEPYEQPAGATETLTTITSITVVNGIITDIQGT